MCTNTYISGGQKTTFRGLLVLSTVCIPWIKLKSTKLAASTSTFWALSMVPDCFSSFDSEVLFSSLLHLFLVPPIISLCNKLLLSKYYRYCASPSPCALFGGGGGSIKTLMLWTPVWVPCVWEAWALTWNTKELVPKKTILSMLELRQHMCILCKMYISQAKAVIEQGVNPDQGSKGQDVCHGEQVNKQHPSWLLLQFLPWVPLSAFLSGLWPGICKSISHFLSQIVSDLYPSSRNLIRTDGRCRRKPEDQPSRSWVSPWKGITLGIETKTSCTPDKHWVKAPTLKDLSFTLHWISINSSSWVSKGHVWSSSKPKSLTIRGFRFCVLRHTLCTLAYTVSDTQQWASLEITVLDSVFCNRKGTTTKRKTNQERVLPRVEPRASLQRLHTR